MAEFVFHAGEWHRRADDWRDEIDLATADRPIVYAAGLADGRALAMTEFAAMWQLLLDIDAANEAMATGPKTTPQGVAP